MNSNYELGAKGNQKSKETTPIPEQLEYISTYQLQLVRELNEQLAKEIVKSCVMNDKPAAYFCRVILSAIEKLKASPYGEKLFTKEGKEELVDDIKTFLSSVKKKNWYSRLISSLDTEVAENNLAEELKRFLIGKYSG